MAPFIVPPDSQARLNMLKEQQEREDQQPPRNQDTSNSTEPKPTG
jgi:hypothetical protein